MFDLSAFLTRQEVPLSIKGSNSLIWINIGRRSRKDGKQFAKLDDITGKGKLVIV